MSEPTTSAELGQVVARRPTGPPLLEVRSVAVFYGDVQALWDVSLTVHEGEFVAVIGSNGAGKTTLLNTLAGLLKSSGGEIRLRGQPVQALPAHALCREGLTLSPQGGQVFPDMTVRENLEVGAYLQRARSDSARNLARVWELFPHLRERQAQLAGTLSGGERQMLAIARALMSGPRLLMLDEPSLAVAPVLVEQIFETLHRLHQEGLTVLLVEQNVQEALELADRAYVLETGRVVREGRAGELLGDAEVRRHFLGV
jgi:branched-chain amino acid transport system ATP-binding protein